ncbi:hypothetical protein AVEN_45525-1 [Araneus ventricosus]|uniref:Uncharacterized protein n=1 Tax=Araneus ventricosus TaxID=182803 RepID=A0A4Y2F3Z2_ARAVE|nr:hypothetical protein AVEN_45525-1 [Araneus ventricosus]
MPGYHTNQDPQTLNFVVLNRNLLQRSSSVYAFIPSYTETVGPWAHILQTYPDRTEVRKSANPLAKRGSDVFVLARSAYGQYNKTRVVLLFPFSRVKHRKSFFRGL